VSNKLQTTNDSSDVAGDDLLRSRYLQRLLHRFNREQTSLPSYLTPLTLIQYWDESEVPSDVKRCVESWRVLENRGFTRQLYDKGLARVFIGDHFSDLHLRAFDLCTHPAMRSDYFRLCFLFLHGGMYVDADDELQEPEAIPTLIDSGMLQLQPLCYQRSTDSMVVPIDFVETISDDLFFYVANDPIVTPARHPIIEAALSQATDRLIDARGSSRDIQWLTGPGNLSEVLVRHSLNLERKGVDNDFRFIPNWVKIAPGDWTLEYRNDDRNWRLWITGDSSQ
jgi:mannosyltransferase OCH1-like enzyme